MEATMIRQSKTLAAVLLVAGSLIALAGCAHGGGSLKSSALDGTRWQLTDWMPSSVSRADTIMELSPVHFTITADFANGRISGTSAVNSYSGPYKTGPGNAFSVGPLASTEIAGPGPAMRAESAYMELLTEAKSYKMAAGTLTLCDQAGIATLVFASENK
jgi:heat shock protein HslJ